MFKKNKNKYKKEKSKKGEPDLLMDLVKQKYEELGPYT